MLPSPPFPPPVSTARRAALPRSPGSVRAPSVKPGSAAELAQDELEDAAVAEVLHLVGGVDADLGVELLAIGTDGDLAREVARPSVLEPDHVECLVPNQAQRLDRGAILELERQDAHADQIK